MKIKDFNSRLELAKEIEKNYLNFTRSPMEVNVDEKTINLFKNNLFKYNNEYKNQNIIVDLKDDVIFVNIREAIINNLQDTFLRFKFSKSYLQFKNDYKILKLVNK
jgi:hypothetical protein